MTTTAPRTDAAPLGVKRFGEFGAGGFDQCWYPIALSAEVAPGQVVGRDFLDGRVVCFRGDNGVSTVLSAYCRHLGTDLTKGAVIGNELRCGFHYWCYGQHGDCTKIPVSDRIPEDSSLFAYPTAESCGLIWAFNGAEPLYEVPAFPDVDVTTRAVRAGDMGVLAVPTFLATANSMDFQHLEVVHGVPNDADVESIEITDTTIEYDMVWHDPTFGRIEQHIKDFGTNVVSITGTMGGMHIAQFFAGRPVPGDMPGGHTHGYIVVSVPKAELQGLSEAEVDQQLDLADAYARGLIAEDQEIFRGLRFRIDKLVTADRGLSRFFRYCERYPKAHPGAARIR
jgi:phenylpropionate dioxygenase-like ring-hydroxylating dioxygenase large terminal subunit